MTVSVDAVDYHRLRVSDVDRLTDDAVAITFDVPEQLLGTFRFVAGQHVAVKADIDGRDVRRTYSVCVGPAEDRLRIGVKRVQGGAFSTFATEQLRPGDNLEVAAPHGDFIVTPHPTRSMHYAAIAAGSGITPVLAMISAVLDVEPGSCFTLVFGNRASTSIMFLEELQGLKDRYPERFQLIHVLSREAQIIPMLSGRLDGERLGMLFDSLVDVTAIDHWYLCGPLEMVETARLALTARGIDPGVVDDELFFSEPTPPAPPEPLEAGAGAVTMTFTLDGHTSSVAVDPDGPPLLSYALQKRRDTPFSCRGGMCTTCKAKVLDGDVRMDLNFALNADDLEKGFILTCQSHPVSEKLEITYDV